MDIFYVLELDIGKNILMQEDNHVTICKPKDRTNKVFRSIIGIIHQIINEQYEGKRKTPFLDDYP